MLTQDPLSVVEGRPYGRGVIIGVAAGLGCALIVLGIDVLESVDKQAKVALKKNPNDPRNAGWVDRIVLQLGVAQSLQMTRFNSGEVDLLPALPPAEQPIPCVFT